MTRSSYYDWNSEEINQVLSEEINETFPTYYDDLKNLDDSWKPKSLQGENSKALLFLPFLPKWDIWHGKRVFFGIWDVKSNRIYDLEEKFVQIIWPQIQLLDQRIMGTLLANGNVRENLPFIYFDLKNAQHAYWKYIFLKPFMKFAPVLIQNKDNRIGKAYHSYTDWVFQDYRELFYNYPNGKKIVPCCVPDLLSTPEGLAEFFMDIGTFDNGSKQYCLNVNGFSRNEVEYLQQQLRNNHGLVSSIDEKYNTYLQLTLSAKNKPIITSKLYDHLLPMFYSSIGLPTVPQTHEIESSKIRFLWDLT